MFGGENNNPMFTSTLEGNRFQFTTDGLPQLQLFGDFQVGCSIGSLNYVGSEHPTSMNQPIKRTMQAGSMSRQQKHLITLNSKSFQDETDQSGCILNPNPVSTGLRLSYEEDEHNSSVTSASGSIKAALPIFSSLGHNLKFEMDQQKDELDCYLRLQEENFIKGVTELKQRHTASFLGAIEKGICRKLCEKELEMENMNRKNKELVEKTNQVSMEVQSWQYRAKYNESVVNVLKNNLQQIMAQGAMHGKEGCGDSEVDDAASYSNVNHLGIMERAGNLDSTKKQMNCKACKIKEVSVLLLPCRHLCLCKDCEVLVNLCPVCGMMKSTGVQVFFS
ncbi:BOI-related E3 ubiquitin-protein ligase 1-like [Quillaja saponaria]|uniref:BOI-related E3 ubiquitin-protein ligase 1-like n=1 Tax=Quillaja saponaria TaxID=32244 RepID=A0AAD7P8P5_QUISA|nr:BOI-related E3 ubiquitin-protein ligase 1-like [Quillaja saponaria]